MVYFIRNLNWKRAPAQIKTFRNYLNYDANNFCNDLNDVNLTPENIPDENLCDQPVNDLWNTFTSAFVSVVENHAPVIQKRVRRNDNCPSLNSNIKSTIKQRD